MSIRRISELPNVESLDERDRKLSSCLFEVSYDMGDDPSTGEGRVFRSAYMRGEELAQDVVQYIQETDISSLVITSALVLSGAVLSLDNGSSIVMWPNELTDRTSCLLRVETVRIHGVDVEISAEQQLGLYGDPVVINDNLSVGGNYAQTDNKVVFSSDKNEIKAASCDFTAEGNAARVITCGMLKDTVQTINEALDRFISGKGVPH